jgi:hypothetical protein
MRAACSAASESQADKLIPRSRAFSRARSSTSAFSVTETFFVATAPMVGKRSDLTPAKLAPKAACG